MRYYKQGRAVARRRARDEAAPVDWRAGRAYREGRLDVDEYITCVAPGGVAVLRGPNVTRVFLRGLKAARRWAKQAGLREWSAGFSPLRGSLKEVAKKTKVVDLTDMFT